MPRRESVRAMGTTEKKNRKRIFKKKNRNNVVVEL